MKKLAIVSKTVFPILLLIALLFGIAYPEQASAPTPPKNITLTIGGGFPGSTMFVRAEAIATLLRKLYPSWTITTLAGAPSSFLQLFNEGKTIDMLTCLGLPKAYDVVLRTRGRAQTIRPRTVLFTGAAMPQHAIAIEDLPIKSILDLKNKRYPVKVHVAPGKGGPPDIITEWFLETYGITYKDIVSWGGQIKYVPIKDFASAFQSGEINLWFQYTGVPMTDILEAATRVKLKMIPYGATPEILKTIREKTDLAPWTIQAKTYPFQNEDYKCLACLEGVEVAANFSEDAAYWITKAVWENLKYLYSCWEGYKETLNREIGISYTKDYGLPIHPGAQKYYREVGWLR